MGVVAVNDEVLRSPARLRAVIGARRVLPALPVPLDAVARMAARLTGASMAVVSLVGADDEEFLGTYGLPESLAVARRRSGEHFVCAYVVSADAMVAVADMSADTDLARHPLVSGWGVRSFAGVPLRDEQHRPVGAVTVLDSASRCWSASQLRAVEEIAGLLGPVPVEQPTTVMAALRDARENAADVGSVPVAVSCVAQAEMQRGFISALLDSLQVGVFAVDADRRPVLFNRALRRLCGLPEESSPAQGLADACRQLHHLDGAPFREDDLAVVNALAGRSVRDVESVLHAPDRPDRYLLANAEPIRAADGELLGAVSTVQDVSERRRSERFRDHELHIAQILNESDNLAQAAPAVLEAVGQAMQWQHVALLLVDEVADVLRMTAYWSAPGIDVDDLVPEFIPRGDAGPGEVWATGRPLWLPDLTDPRYAVTPEARAFAHSAAGRGLRASMAVPVLNGDTVLGVLVSLCNTSDDNTFLSTGLLDSVAAQLGHFVARRRSAELTLQLAWAKEDFLTLVSHELRTPLASIVSCAGLLTDMLDDPELQQLLHTVTRNTNTLQQIIDNLLHLVAVESGQVSMNRGPTNLTDLVDAAVAVAPQRDDLRIHARLPPVLMVHGDRDRLRLIVDHLLSNAVKYSPDGGAIHLSAHEDGGIVELAIADAGIGIPEDDRDRLFSRFHRGSNARHSNIVGTGLGLALVRSLVEAHHGTISYDPAHQPGTRIVVRLPQHPTRG